MHKFFDIQIWINEKIVGDLNRGLQFFLKFTYKPSLQHFAKKKIGKFIFSFRFLLYENVKNFDFNKFLDSKWYGFRDLITVQKLGACC